MKSIGDGPPNSGGSNMNGGDGGIRFDLQRVTRRMDNLETDMANERESVKGKLDELITLIGKPENGTAQPASGLFAKIDSLDRRVRPFEKFRERAVGAIFLGGPMLVALWWLGGDKIGTLFHG